MTDTSREAVEALIGRLREKAQGKRNSVGDVWGDWICEDAASMLSSLLSEREKQEENRKKLFDIAYHHQERAEAAEAARAKAEEALARIVKCDMGVDTTSSVIEAYAKVIGIAVAARTGANNAE